MAKKNVTVETEQPIVTETVDTGLDTSQKFKNLWDKFGKQFMVGFAVGVLAFGGYYGYKKLVKEPKVVTGNEAIFPVENFFDKMVATGFNKDSIKIALEGGVVDSIKFVGLLDIINKQSGSPAANRATYMAGACYLNNNEFDKAIKYLNDFSANGAYQFDVKKHMMLGHANAELKKTDAALSEYTTATTINTKDEPFTTDALMTAASYAESLGKNKEAIEFYQKLKDNYPSSQVVTGGDVDKYLAKLGVTK
jgi:predicted negative regulator of RcsB-dependent stress response